MSKTVVQSMKEYIYRYDDNSLYCLAVAEWNRILRHENCVPEFAGRTIKIIYAYIEFHHRRPIYCQRIDAVNCLFDLDGYYISPPVPDPGLLNHCVQVKVTNIASYRDRSEYRKYRYWDITPTLLDRILDTIWRDPC